MGLILWGCAGPQAKQPVVKPKLRTRSVVDTVGFAHLAWQMDSIISRTKKMYGDTIVKCTARQPWKVVISPHDDYTYTAGFYAKALKCVKAKTLILFGVAHKARKFNLENKIIFGTFDQWQAPYGPVKLSSLKGEIISQLPDSLYLIHNDMMAIEHSLEAMIPFLQYFNKEIEIVPILVPYMPYRRMMEIAAPLALAIETTVQKHGLRWGKDFAIVISTDAVHYGDKEWGGKNFARFGTDSEGTEKAVAYEHEIINNCLTGRLNPVKIERFTKYTVDSTDFRKYIWTWCGRYSVPMGLATAFELGRLENHQLTGTFLGYGNSIDHPHLNVKDLRMGITGIAERRHWVGYAAIGYR